jgi:hypothetical protein
VAGSGFVIAAAHRLGTPQRDFLRFLDWPDSDKAMAIACLWLVTFLPELLRNVPTFSSCMTFSTFRFCCAVVMARSSVSA